MLVNINVSFYSQQKHVRANSTNIFDLHFHDKLKDHKKCSETGFYFTLS